MASTSSTSTAVAPAGTSGVDPIAALTAPGARFALAEEDVLGVPMRVLAGRQRSLSEFVAASARFGDREYIVADDGTRWTYAEHARAVASVACALRERYGVRPGDRVAILAANRPEWLVTFWATVSLGAVAVGMNGWWAGDEIRYGLADSEPKVLVADRRRLDRLADAPQVPDVPVIVMENDFADLVAYAPDAELPGGPGQEDDPALILYTSGTTGRPKGAVLTHRNVIAMQNVQALLAARATAHLPEEQRAAIEARAGRWLVNSPFFHVSGLLAGAVAAFADGHTMVLYSGRFDVPAVLSLVEREKCTNWSVVPTVGWRVVNHPDVGDYDLSSVTRLGGGSAAFAPELVARLQQVFPKAKGAMGVGYGLTESGGVATSAGAAQIEATVGAIGAAVPTVQVEIHDEDGARLPDGVEGEIWIRSPLVMLEYWRNAEASAKSLTPDRWLRTGDLGYVRDGQFFMATRRSDLILRGGENVYPAEIEHCLDAHPEVAESVVIGVPHAELGEEVKAIVVPKPGGGLAPESLAAYVKDRLAYYKVPSHWEIRTEPLPRTATGKVIRAVVTGVKPADLVEE